MRTLIPVCTFATAAVLLPYFTRAGGAAEPALNAPPEGFTALFNGQDLTGW